MFNKEAAYQKAHRAALARQQLILCKALSTIKALTLVLAILFPITNAWGFKTDHDSEVGATNDPRDLIVHGTLTAGTIMAGTILNSDGNPIKIDNPSSLGHSGGSSPWETDDEDNISRMTGNVIIGQPSIEEEQIYRSLPEAPTGDNSYGYSGGSELVMPPDEKLELHGKIKFTDPDKTNFQWARMFFEASDDLYGSNLIFETFDNRYEGFKFRAGAHHSSSTDDLVFFRGDGNVGIGTTLLSQKLDVRGDTLIIGNTNISGNVGIGTTREGDGPEAKLDVRGNALISENVGIGTKSPKAKLDVRGNALITGNMRVKGIVAMEEYLQVYDKAAIGGELGNDNTLRVHGRVEAEKFKGDGSLLTNLQLENKVAIGGTFIGDGNTLRVHGRVQAESLEVDGSVEATSFKGDDSLLTGLPWDDCPEDSTLANIDHGDIYSGVEPLEGDCFFVSGTALINGGVRADGLYVTGDSTTEGMVRAGSIEFKNSDGNYQGLLEQINDLSNKIGVLTDHVDCLGKFDYGVVGGVYIRCRSSDLI